MIYENSNLMIIFNFRVLGLGVLDHSKVVDGIGYVGIWGSGDLGKWVIMDRLLTVSASSILNIIVIHICLDSRIML